MSTASNDSSEKSDPRVVLLDILKYTCTDMEEVKTIQGANNLSLDDDNVRYKLNEKFFNNIPSKPDPDTVKDATDESEDDVLYMFPTNGTEKVNATKQKNKKKHKIKVNFWSNKNTINRINSLHSKDKNRRHTIAVNAHDSTKSKNKSNLVKVSKQVSFLPSPEFTDNHIPMVTVPDDLTIHLNAEEAIELRKDLNAADEAIKSKKKLPITDDSPRGIKRKLNASDNSLIHAYDSELEYFSKYIVQKLRRMETNQRIYSENLIHTVLMLGQLGQLNMKFRVCET